MPIKSKLLILLFMLIAFINSFIFSANDSAVIPLSSPIYGYLDDLYILEGHAPAQGARPWTHADLKQQLDRITPTNEASKHLYDIINDFIEKDRNDKVSFDLNINIDPSIAAHSNAEDFDTSDKWVSEVLNDKLLGLNFGLYVKNYFAANIGLSLGFVDATNSRGTEDLVFKGSANEDRFSSVFATNIPFISDGSIDPDVTDNTYLSLGNEYISFVLARGQVSWGNGVLGNLMLGNTLPYHDYISLSASNNTWFDYTMLVSFFPHPQNYYNQSIEDEVSGIQMFIGHRFEFRMFKDKLRLSLNESIMYHSMNGSIDFRAFNPLIILHGIFIPANANSLATVEVEYAPIKNLQLYVSAALDDYALPNEPQPPEYNSTLNMWGVMGGARGTVPIKIGYFSLNLEVVYTSPLMYHKDSYQDDTRYNYVMDYVGAIRLSNGNYRREYLSFPFGSDAFVIYTGAAYNVPQNWSVGMKFLFMAHGVTDENSIAKKYDGVITEVPGWLATSNPFSDEEGEIEYIFNIGLDGEYYILDNLRISTGIDFIYAVNFDNQAGNAFDIQWTLSLKYSVF